MSEAKTIARAEYYQVLADQSGGKLTADEVYNLEKFGVKDPKEFADLEDYDDGRCICGEVNCPDAYAHTTSGY